MKRRIRYSEFVAPPTPPAPETPVAPAYVPTRASPVAPSRPTPARSSRAVPSRLTPAISHFPVPAMRPTPALGIAAIPGAVLHGPASPREARPSGSALVVREQASLPLRKRARARSGSADLLVFRIGSEQFAVALGAVEEVVDLATVHHVPEMPSAMVGVVTVRGALTPVYAPAAALGIALATGTSALIFRRGRARIALAIDDVDDVFTLDLALLRDAPLADDGDGVVLGVVRQGDALIAVLDADALIACCQAVPVLESA